jgi:transcriptional regulator with XRE-family HTH domain
LLKIFQNRSKFNKTQKTMTKNKTTQEIALAVTMEFKRQGLTMTEAAKRLGVAPGGLTPYTSGKRIFGGNIAKKWAAAFGFSEEFLMFGRGELVQREDNTPTTPTTPQEHTPTPTTSGVFIPSETLQMYTDMAASIRNLTELLGGVGLLKGDVDYLTGQSYLHKR